MAGFCFDVTYVPVSAQALAVEPVCSTPNAYASSFFVIEFLEISLISRHFFLFQVEIKCMGQPLIPTLQLNSLLELWLQTGAPTEKVPVQVGSTGKEFVMVLSYGRKVPRRDP